MKIKVIETKVEEIEKEIDIIFPFYYTVDFSDYSEDPEEMDDMKTVYGRITEEGNVTEIVEAFNADDSEVYTLKSDSIDINEIYNTQYYELIGIKEFESDEMEFEETRERFIEYVNEHLGGGFMIGSN